MDVRDVGVALWRQRPLGRADPLVTGAAVAPGSCLPRSRTSATATISAAEAPGASAAPTTLTSCGRASRSWPTPGRWSRGPGPDPRRPERGRAAPRDRGEWRRGTILVEVTVRDRDPDTAAEIANAVARCWSTARSPRRWPARQWDERWCSRPATRRVPPDTFSSPDVRLAVGLGMLLALGLATAAAVLRDRRTTPSTTRPRSRRPRSAPLLAHLTQPRDLTTMPALQPGDGGGATCSGTCGSRSRPQTEAGGTPWVVIAGIASGDINVWIGANVALALAGTGRRVLLVDGRMGERFGTPLGGGAGHPRPLRRAARRRPRRSDEPRDPVELLQVLPAGTYGYESIPELIAQRFPTRHGGGGGRVRQRRRASGPRSTCATTRG